jgi:hypothetical protein
VRGVKRVHGGLCLLPLAMAGSSTRPARAARTSPPAAPLLLLRLDNRHQVVHPLGLLLRLGMIASIGEGSLVRMQWQGWSC